jgi:hypothetical protein
LHVEHAHAGEHGVFHRAAEVGLGHQPLLRCRRRRVWRQVPISIQLVIAR